VILGKGHPGSLQIPSLRQPPTWTTNPTEEYARVRKGTGWNAKWDCLSRFLGRCAVVNRHSERRTPAGSARKEKAHGQRPESEVSLARRGIAIRRSRRACHGGYHHARPGLACPPEELAARLRRPPRPASAAIGPTGRPRLPCVLPSTAGKELSHESARSTPHIPSGIGA
jgi:hypothetical protein